MSNRTATIALFLITACTAAAGADPVKDAIAQYEADMAKQRTIAGPPVAIDQAITEASQLAILEILRDPGSAQWGPLRAFKSTTAGRIDVCGQVNGRNAMGGYAGAEPFHIVLEMAGGSWVPASRDLARPGRRGVFFTSSPICNPASWQ